MNTSRSRREDEDAITDAETGQLRKQYRVLHNDYKAYKEETKRDLRKQKNLRAALEKEHEELMKCINKIDVPKNKVKDGENVVTLNDLGMASVEYSKLISEEKSNLEDLENSIIALERKISALRKCGSDQALGDISATDKRRTVLENRLDLATRKLNTQLSLNKKLHSDIDGLQTERHIFLNLCKKLEKKLKDIKEEKSQIIEQTTIAFDLRDEAQNKIKALRERHEKDRYLQESEFKELQRIIAHDNRIKGFLQNNTSDRATLKAEERDKKRQRKDPDEAINADKMTVTSYEEVFKDIQNISEKDGVEEIVEHFLSVERDNFALFNLVTEKNSECMMLEEELGAMRVNIEEVKRQGTYLTENYMKMKDSLQSQIEKTKREKNTLLKRSFEQTEMLEKLFANVHKLFSSLECEDRPITEMLGSAKINPKNVMAYIGLIEKKATELLSYQAFLKHKESLLHGPPAPNGKFGLSSPALQSKKSKGTLVVCPPSLEDGSLLEEISSELKPLSRSDIADKLSSNNQLRMTALLDSQRSEQSKKAK